MPQVLTTASQAQCPHGGQVLLTTANTLLSVGGSPVLLESDVHSVVGCPFSPGGVYTPCVTVQWQAAAADLNVNGTGVLVETSIGECLNAAEAPQGVAIVSGAASELDTI
ncbi:conserved hypothetical protein [Syntrophobacter sp. SbD1]|nr:conserved hypothetical protein [Syntrophobacter sp. SbD1]